MDFAIEGKVALVLGAGGGLGGAIARALAAEGATLVATDIDAAAASQTAAEIVGAGGKATPLAWDLASIDGHVASIEERFGAVGILVNNTGAPPPGPASGQPTEVWSRHFESMVRSVIAITDRVLPGMTAAKWGRILTSTSSGVVAPIPNLGLSNALRLALVGWSKTLAREVGQYGITANIVLPGRVAAKRITFLDEQKAKREGRDAVAVAEESAASIPVGRYGRPEE